MIFKLFYHLSIINTCVLIPGFLHARKEIKGEVKRSCIVCESEFSKVVQSPCFVDKSLIAQDFLNMNLRIALVTAPRRFGKSVNMKMLKAFLQTENGLISSNQTVNCGLFIKHNMNIFNLNNNTFFYLHCGQYPVIYANFKQIKGRNFDDILGDFASVVHKAFKEHRYLLNSTRLDDSEKRRASLYIDEMTYEGLTERQLRKGLEYLSEMLYMHFNRKVIVLIDDFDAPVWVLLTRDFSETDVHKTIQFFSDVMSELLEANSYVERALINACVRLSGILSLNANTVPHFSFLGNHPLVTYYGLTEEEMREKLNYFNIIHSYEDVRSYYDGYKTEGSADKVYSTWSILNYLQYEKLKDYWIDSAGLTDLDKLFVQTEIRRLITQLLDWKVFTIGTRKQISISDIMILKDIMINHRNYSNLEAATFLIFLSDNGYFNPTYNTFDDRVSLTIPNKEIYLHLYDAVYSQLYFLTNCNTDFSKTKLFLQALNTLTIDENNTDSLADFRNSITDLYSNVTLPNNENALKGNIYFHLKNSESFSFTDVEVGRKVNGTMVYSDIVTVRNRDDAGIIIETGCSWKSAEEALQQIIDKSYYKVLDSVDKYRRNVKKGRIYIGLYISDNGSAEVCCLSNSNDINSKVCV